VFLKTPDGLGAATGQIVSVPVNISNEREIEGMSFALVGREGLLAPEVLDLAGTRVGALRGGAGPEYLKTHVDGSGHCIGVAFVGSTSQTKATIPPSWEQPLVLVRCRAGDRTGTEVLEFADACGSFASPRVAVIAGFAVEPDTAGSSVAVAPGTGGFIRGDVNFDRALNIADAVAILAFLFSGVPNDCHDAVDANDDGSLNVADAVYLLSYLFASGAAPRAPFPAPGTDPTQDGYDCARFPF
jgi:hypothetical protein